MPADPVMRARARLFLFQFEVELFAHIEALENGNQKQQDRARQHVADQLTQMAPVCWTSYELRRCGLCNAHMDKARSADQTRSHCFRA